MGQKVSLGENETAGKEQQSGHFHNKVKEKLKCFGTRKSKWDEEEELEVAKSEFCWLILAGWEWLNLCVRTQNKGSQSPSS